MYRANNYHNGSHHYRPHNHRPFYPQNHYMPYRYDNNENTQNRNNNEQSRNDNNCRQERKYEEEDYEPLEAIAEMMSEMNYIMGGFHLKKFIGDERRMLHHHLNGMRALKKNHTNRLERRERYKNTRSLGREEAWRMNKCKDERAASTTKISKGAERFARNVMNRIGVENEKSKSCETRRENYRRKDRMKKENESKGNNKNSNDNSKRRSNNEIPDIEYIYGNSRNVDMITCNKAGLMSLLKNTNFVKNENDNNNNHNNSKNSKVKHRNKEKVKNENNNSNNNNNINELIVPEAKYGDQNEDSDIELLEGFKGTKNKNKRRKR